MRKYLGSVFTAFGALVSPVFIIAPLGFIIVALASEISVATITLSIMLLACTTIWGIFLWKNKYQLYSWGNFSRDAVCVYTFPRRKNILSYIDCKGCGIGFYRHSLLNNQDSKFGSNVYFIFLSLEPFEEKYRTQMNKWIPSDSRIKLQFSKKIYFYLLDCLPKKQSEKLECDYGKFLGPKKA